MANKGVETSDDEVREQMIKRDQADLMRKTGPLRRSQDSIYIDTTGLDINEVLDVLTGYITNERKNT